MIYAIAGSADELKKDQPIASGVIHVSTAIDHLTVLEFREPVTMAAAGSSAFQIERRENKVFIKPLKTGASTDLFVWTGSRRFAYELEPPGEVTNMNFAIDSQPPVTPAAENSTAQLEGIADMMLTRAFLGARQVNSSSIKDQNGRVSVRIEHVFQTSSTLYIHYSIRNMTARPYRVSPPELSELSAPNSAISIPSLQRTQIDGKVVRKLGKVTERPVPLVRAESQKQDLQPGERTQGVIVVRQQVSAPAIFRVNFGPDGMQAVQATMVF
jgi:hypothetical protein